MAKLGDRLWLGGALLTAAALVVGACGNDDDANPSGRAGSGGDGGKRAIAGQGGSAQAGASAGHAGNGGQAGEGGQAGAAACIEGLQVVKIVNEASNGVISWREAKRVAAKVGQGVSIYELGDNGEVTLVEKLGPKELGLSASGSIYSLTRYGDGFVVRGSTDAEAREARIVVWQPGEEPETVPLPEPQPAWFVIHAADPEVGIVTVSNDGIRLARVAPKKWTWTGPFSHDSRRSIPLALESDRMLVGVEELDRFSMGGAGNEGGAGSGGAGGEAGAAEVPSRSPHARVEWWSLDGQRQESHQAVGNPEVAIKLTEGWLIGETNSFWGSYEAAIELLPNSGPLQKLTDVPVISAGDGTDGAVDLALLGQRLFVANCESGLRVGDWSTHSLTLHSLPGAWGEGDLANCSPRDVETLGDLIVIGGDNVVFARACE